MKGQKRQSCETKIYVSYTILLYKYFYSQHPHKGQNTPFSNAILGIYHKYVRYRKLYGELLGALVNLEETSLEGNFTDIVLLTLFTFFAALEVLHLGGVYHSKIISVFLLNSRGKDYLKRKLEQSYERGCVDVEDLEVSSYVFLAEIVHAIGGTVHQFEYQPVFIFRFYFLDEMIQSLYFSFCLLI